MDFTVVDIFQAAVSLGCSDIHIKPGSKPKARVNKDLVELSQFPVLTGDMTSALIYETMAERDIALFSQDDNYDHDYSYDLPSIGRFRMNAASTMGKMAVVGRLLSDEPKSLDDLGSPQILKKLAMLKDGIIIVSGPTGSGKSSTLSAVINEINLTKSVHIISTEQPIEIVHKDIKASISQREVGVDVDSYEHALKASLRQDPDVILVGEVRSLDAMRTVLVASDTGHLVLTTLHTTDTAETINRILSMYPTDERNEVRRALASSLRAVVSQRLVHKKGGKGVIGVHEILINNAEITDLILDEKSTGKDIRRVIQSSNNIGMQTFDQSLEWLLQADKIDLATAKEMSPDHFANAQIVARPTPEPRVATQPTVRDYTTPTVPQRHNVPVAPVTVPKINTRPNNSGLKKPSLPRKPH
jgi:twitching motility protein PilT